MSTIATNNLMARLSEELRQDLGVLYGMGVKNPHEPESKRAWALAMQITAPPMLFT